ncbi:efflux RND transporter periplasmic adaptor subunit [Marinicellulosiphila megalodicopiae]|uniref:efflux RND transporter periplasmic adaptor subunit n=1 Tax=Marinicellulosiphila megalodicopiae TaxID=2724896 RepID=UPI003BAEFC2E
MKKIIILAVFILIGVGGYLLLTQSSGEDQPNQYKGAAQTKAGNSDSPDSKQSSKLKSQQEIQAMSSQERRTYMQSLTDEQRQQMRQALGGGNREKGSETQFGEHQQKQADARSSDKQDDTKTQSAKTTPTSPTTSPTPTPSTTDTAPTTTDTTATAKTAAAQNQRPGSNSPQNAARQMQSALGNSRWGRQNLTSNATQIEAVTLVEDSYSPQLPILAKIKAKVTDNIAAPAAVRVVKVLATAGEYVETGQLLVELDSSDLQLSIQAQQAAVDQQQASIRIAQLQYNNNLVLLENAKTNLKKEQTLLKDGFSNDSSIEAATDKLRSAQLTVDLFKEEKISRETNLTSAKINLQKLQSQLSDYLIKAPYPAKIINLNATVNQKLKAGDQVITLIDQNSLIASGQVPATKHALLSLNKTQANLTVDNKNTQLILTYLASSAERGAVNVEFLLPSDKEFVVGDTIELKINLQSVQSFIVPSDSIYQGQYVYLIREDRLQQTKVEILGYQFINDSQWTLIQADDLENDTQILATRLSSPATGTSVKVIKELSF